MQTTKTVKASFAQLSRLPPRSCVRLHEVVVEHARTGARYTLDGVFTVSTQGLWRMEDQWRTPHYVADAVRLSGPGVSSTLVVKPTTDPEGLYSLTGSRHEKRRKLFTVVSGTMTMAANTGIRLGPSPLCLNIDGSISVGCHRVTTQQLAQALPLIQQHVAEHGVL